MSAPRDIVKAALTFNYPHRLPRDLWLLPIAADQYPATIKFLQENYSNDFTSPDYFYPASPKTKGDPYIKGIFTDEWGCTFFNIRDGIMGEVRQPVIHDIPNGILLNRPMINYRQDYQGGKLMITFPDFMITVTFL